MNRKKNIKIIEIMVGITGGIFGGLNIIAKIRKSNSIYENAPEEKNPLEGHRVVFIEDRSDIENADGVRGHLKSVGVCDYRPGIYEKYIKRALDIVLSFGGLVVLFPVYLGISLAIVIDDPGPVLFTQKRMGKNKKYFKLHKFRSMKMCTPHDVPTHMLDNPEQYITRVGKFLRAHSLDELPQIWDIFIGNMSVIGPRPGLWNQDVLTAERDKYGANDVKPGLTGWAQINGRDELEIPAKAKLDGEYVQKESFFFDVKCFLGTVGKIAKDDSVVEGGTGEMKRKDSSADGEVGKKILVVCQYYKPEPFRHPDICEELVKCGYDVTVVTGLPNYPMGKIYNGYRHGRKRDEVIEGVRIHRCFTIGRRKGAIYRFLNYYSFVWSSKVYIKRIKQHYDLVYVHQLSPVMMAEAGISYKRKYNVPLILNCLDLWPESLVAGGIHKNSIIYNLFLNISRKIYRQADVILATSKCFSEYFKDKFGINNVVYLPQYAEDIFKPEECKKMPDDYIDVMFAGNVGTVQSVDTLIEAAKLTKDIQNLRWHIVGDGSEIERMKDLAEGMNQVIFHGRKPLNEMPKYYAMADAMLIAMKKDAVLSMTLPGKVQSYMAAGKPILGAIDGETQQAINEAGCGICGPAEDAIKLAMNVRAFVLQNDKEQFGINAKDYYDKYFTKGLFMSKLRKEFDKCIIEGMEQ